MAETCVFCGSGVLSRETGDGDTVTTCLTCTRLQPYDGPEGDFPDTGGLRGMTPLQQRILDAAERGLSAQQIAAVVGVTYDYACAILRRQRKALAESRGAPSEHEPPPTKENEMLTTPTRAEVARASLPPTSPGRQVLDLALLGYAPDQIAARLGFTPGATRVILAELDRLGYLAPLAAAS